MPGVQIPLSHTCKASTSNLRVTALMKVTPRPIAHPHSALPSGGGGRRFTDLAWLGLVGSIDGVRNLAFFIT